MPTTTDVATIRNLTAPQWRLLGALHGSERRTESVPRTGNTHKVIDCRTLLNRQDAKSDDLLALSAAGLIEGVIPGATINLAHVNWKVGMRSSHYVSARITTKGTKTVRDTPAIMLIRSIGRGHRYMMREVIRAAGVTVADVADAEDAGLITASGDDGQQVPLSMFKRAEIPTTLRLSLTRKGGSFLERHR